MKAATQSSSGKGDVPGGERKRLALESPCETPAVVHCWYFP